MPDAEQVPSRLRAAGVTRREADVLRLVGGRLQNREIAEALHVSERTVESHVSSLLRKLGVTQRRMLVDAADEFAVRRRGVLRQPLSSFFGREQETVQVASLVQRHRLVTLTGPPGVGKTRLALHVAGTLPHPATWVLVDLASTAPDDPVTRVFADSLGIAADERRLLSQLRDVLAHGDHWLLVDNCEHVAESTSRLLDELLGTCTSLHVLATGHTPLGVAGEALYDVAPLQPSEAERLFADRAAKALPSFTLDDRNSDDVAAICRKLDGLPLAIELAAARLRAFSPSELFVRLQDRFALLADTGRGATGRHRTLEAAIRWSYELLDEDERVLFERCSVFPGSFDFDTADAVVSDPPAITHDDVVRVFPRLLDRSLLSSRRDGPTTEYRLLDSIRHFAQSRLEERGGLAAIRERHAVHHLQGGPAWMADLQGRDQAGALRWFEQRWPDIRAAVHWALDTGNLDAAWTFISGVGTGWEILGARGELFDWLDRLLEHPLPPSRLGVQAAVTASLLRCYQDTGAALETARHGVELAAGPALGEHSRSLATMAVGWALMYDGQAEPAREQFHRAVDEFRGHGDDWHLAFSLEGLALAGRDLDDTLDHLRQAADAFGRIGDLVKRSNCLIQMASRCIDVGSQPDDIETWLTEARDLAESTPSNHERLHAEVCLARLEQLRGRPAAAGAAFETLLPEFRRIGDLRCLSRCLNGVGMAALHAGAYDVAAENLADSVRIAQSTGDRREIAQGLRLLAECALAGGGPHRAALLLGCAEGVAGQLDPGRRPVLDTEHLLSLLRNSLGESFELAMSQGRASTPADLLPS
ncbi:hypothetical protein C1A38_25145 [Verrucosispora sp. ts21]|nr:hypothetical protein C1A38_25145 [Verrucosispora sp. ts21]